MSSESCLANSPHPQLRSQAVARPHHLSNFPRNLKMLSLSGLGYSWKYMKAIRSLRHLNVLKLRCSAFQGPKWETEAEEFSGLEFLLLEDIDLNEHGFPNLKRLTLRHCFKLKHISSLENPRTVGRIEVDDCSRDVVASARRIHYINKSSSTRVVINSSWNL